MNARQAEPICSGASAANSRRAVGVLCAIAVILLFASFTLVSRLGFASTLQPMDLAAMRFSIAGVLMAPSLWHYGLSGVRRRDAAALALFGGLGFALAAFTGFSLAPAAHGGVLLHGTLALTTFALARITSGAQASRRRAVGLVTILAGIAAIGWDSIAAGSGGQLLGDGALLLASFSWSAYGLLAQRLALAPAQSASIVAVLSMCCFLPGYVLLPGAGRSIFLATWQELLLQGMFQGVLIGAASIFVYSRAVAALGAVQTALFTAAVPAVTTMAAIFVLAERPSSAVLFGVVLVTVGMALAMKA